MGGAESKPEGLESNTVRINLTFTTVPQKPDNMCRVVTQMRNHEYEMPTEACIQVGARCHIGDVVRAVTRWLQMECDSARSDQLSPRRGAPDNQSPQPSMQIPKGVQIASWKFPSAWKFEFNSSEMQSPHAFYFKPGERVMLHYNLKLEQRTRSSTDFAAVPKSIAPAGTQNKNAAADMFNSCMCGRKVC